MPDCCVGSGTQLHAQYLGFSPLTLEFLLQLKSGSLFWLRTGTSCQAQTRIGARPHFQEDGLNWPTVWAYMLVLQRSFILAKHFSNLKELSENFVKMYFQIPGLGRLGILHSRQAPRGCCSTCGSSRPYS